MRAKKMLETLDTPFAQSLFYVVFQTMGVENLVSIVPILLKTIYPLFWRFLSVVRSEEAKGERAQARIGVALLWRLPFLVDVRNQG